MHSSTLFILIRAHPIIALATVTGYFACMAFRLGSQKGRSTRFSQLVKEAHGSERPGRELGGAARGGPKAEEMDTAGLHSEEEDFEEEEGEASEDEEEL